jgi:AraC family transcriptional regulator
MEERFAPEEPAIRHRKGFRIAGLYYAGRNANNEIPQMWEVFINRVGELVPEKDWPFASYGACRMGEGLEEGAFEYLAGVEVDCLDALPEGMVGWEIPEATYAVFKAPSLQVIHEAWGYATGEGLAKLPGYVADDKPCFELYPVEFPDDPAIWLYIPVKPATAG